MNKSCARQECGKTVYPLEELRCLDKVWHKQCFKCTVCGMTLNMKNYKGYGKMPYCDPHYPKTVASVVVDTPEMRRLAENTKIQSQAKYHEEYEKMKGRKIQIADDPEVARHLKNTHVQSNVAYHGELEKRELMEKIRPPLEETDNKMQPPSPSAPPQRQQHSPQYPPHKTSTPYTHKMQQSSTLIYSTDQGGKVNPQTKPVGSIADYDPLNGQWGSATATGRPGGVGRGYPIPANLQQRQMAAQSGARRAGGQSNVFRAMFDYSAADGDEVSFSEGDMIVNGQPVDEGWMTGTVQRTGQWGMLPANYVERVH